MRNLRGKQALITGAASGIGRAIALRLADEGTHLVLVDIDEEGLLKVMAEARRRGVQVTGRCCDVAEPRMVTACVEDVLERLGGVDILVNNAGITYYGRLHRMSSENWDRLMQVNLLSHVQFTRELLPSLLAREEAHVLNVCSVLGLVGMPKVTAYCTTKFGMVGFSESLRNEYGRDGLGVTALCPGFVDTRLFATAAVEDPKRGPKIPPGWLTTSPEKVAAAAVRGIRRNRRLVLAEPYARVLYALKRFAPGLIDFVSHLGRRRRIQERLAIGAEGQPIPTAGMPGSLPSQAAQPIRPAA